SGQLPGGLALDAGTGVIAGRIEGAGTFTFTVQVQDAASRTAQRAFTWVVDQLAIASTQPEGVVFNNYPGLIATGGTTARTWTLVSGTVPPGLSLSASQGLVGRPTTNGVFNLRVSVSDTSSPVQSATQDITVRVSALEQNGGSGGIGAGT